ncbi:hypothetical protein J6A31_07095 [bacterium]|nr:hypothetical protein [bacterium]
MKKLFLTLFFTVLLVNVPAANASVHTQTIEKLENSLYGFTYSGEDDSTRLDRLENSVYGSVSSASFDNRITKLKNDMKVDLIGQEIEPVEDTFADPQDSFIEEEPVAASNVSYPAVDELEEMVFDKNFHGEDIKKRLSKLEVETFGKEFNDDLATRTDRLKAEIKPKSLLDNSVAQSSNSFYDGYVPPLSSDYQLQKYDPMDSYAYDSFNQRQMSIQDDYGDGYLPPVSSSKKYSLNSMEKGVLNQTFKNESEENRISRLESAMFGTNFADDDVETRKNRLSSAYNAQKTAGKYDSNKFAQNMATAMQIGTIILMMLACIL